MKSAKIQIEDEKFKCIMYRCKNRQEVCLDALKVLGGQATANEITRHIYENHIIPFYDTNYVKPRINELIKVGVLRRIGKKKDRFTNKSCTIYSR